MLATLQSDKRKIYLISAKSITNPTKTLCKELKTLTGPRGRSGYPVLAPKQGAPLPKQQAGLLASVSDDDSDSIEWDLRGAVNTRTRRLLDSLHS